MKKRIFNSKLNNEGSAIVTVLIVVLFISILATTILFIAGKNFTMKSSDRKTKESFYENEMVVESIKASIVKLASDAYEDAYNKTLTQFSWTMTNTESRRAYFLDCFKAKMEGDFLATTAISAMDSSDAKKVKLNAYVNGLATYQGESGDIVTITALGDGSGDFIITDDINAGVVRIKGVSVEYTDSDNGFTSKISTSFAIKIPNMEASVSDAEVINAGDFVTYVNWVKE